jgi:hypothetical protein
MHAAFSLSFKPPKSGSFFVMAGLVPGMTSFAGCILSQTLGRNASDHEEAMGCAALRWTYVRVLAARCAPELLAKPFAQENRGRRESRVLAAPAASRAK